MVIKSAFTLAEVLITLGIIGVVAAMTIPNLITSHQKKVTVVKLQKAISVINQAYRLSIDDIGGPPDTVDNMDDYFDTYWRPYLQVSVICDPASKCGYKSRTFACPNGNLGCTGIDNAGWGGKTRMPVMTQDGIMYLIMINAWNPDGTIFGQTQMIDVDINGAQGPNLYGKDVFSLVRSSTTQSISPRGFEESNEEIDKNCSQGHSATYCAEKIRRAGWKIDDSYPWRMKVR